MENSRQSDLRDFYGLLANLTHEIGGAQTLANCSMRQSCPKRGVYFFMENGETRSDTGSGPRIVRVGTHGLRRNSRSTLRKRLSQHRGRVRTPGGNHRASIFRSIVGASISARDNINCASWGSRNKRARASRNLEVGLEAKVSDTIGAMPFVCLSIPDEAGPDSDRGYIERNAIALLSNYEKQVLDSPSEQWLGRYCNRDRVRGSGLWNSNHVNESYDPAFLSRLERYLRQMERDQD